MNLVPRNTSRSSMKLLHLRHQSPRLFDSFKALKKGLKLCFGASGRTDTPCEGTRRSHRFDALGQFTPWKMALSFFDHFRLVMSMAMKRLSNSPTPSSQPQWHSHFQRLSPLLRWYQTHLGTCHLRDENFNCNCHWVPPIFTSLKPSLHHSHPLAALAHSG